MNDYIVKLMSGDEIKITEEEFLKMKGKQGAVYISSINQIVNLNRIERVYKGQQIIEFTKLPEPQIKEKRVKVSGGWMIPSMRERMIKLFKQMKVTGSFKQFNSYENWEKETYK